MSEAPSICGICKTGPDEHAVAEREGVIHHKFSADGVLEEVKVPVAPLGKPRSAADVLKPGGDPVLRFILIQKGLITPDELLAAEKTLQATGLLMTPPLEPKV